jgi:predicted kinase
VSTSLSSLPSLVAFKGHPATGKSVLAEALARRLRWPLIDKDDVKDHLLHLPDANELAYAIMWQIAGTQLALGLSALAVSPLSYPQEYEQAAALAVRHNARLLVVETVVEEAEWRRRLAAGDAAGSAHKIRSWETMQEQLRRYGDSWRYPIDPAQHLRLDTARPLDELVAAVLARLGPV